MALNEQLDSLKNVSYKGANQKIIDEMHRMDGAIETLREKVIGSEDVDKGEIEHLKEIDSEISALQARVTSCETNIANLENKYSELSDEMNEFDEKLDDFDARLKTIEEKMEG